MNNKVLIISGTPIISGAEYVLGDYLKDNENISNMEILHSDIEKVENFYSGFTFSKRFKSKYLNPVGVVGNGKLNLIKKLLNLFLSFFIFYKIFKNKEITKVLGNNTGDTIYAIYSYIFGKKHINYIHDMIEPKSMIAKSVLFFDRFVYRYIAVSKAVKSALIEIGIDESKIEVIYNGLIPNNDYLKKSIDKEIIFGFVGNIDDRKNPMEFLEFIEVACEILKDKKIKAKMVYGSVLDENLYKSMKEKIKNDNLPIELLGRVDRVKMKSFYDDIHFLVLTSKRDPLPTVILEAFNHGVPVIAHNIDGVPEMVENSLNGFLYDSSNHFKKIMESIRINNYSSFQENSLVIIRKEFDLNHKIITLNITLCL